MEYMALNSLLDEIRLITILPLVENSDSVHCTMDIVSLQDNTHQYEAFLPELSASRRKRKRLLGWFCFASPQQTGYTYVVPQVPPAECHRYNWGDYAALSYAWGDPSITTSIVVNGCTTQVTKNLEAALRTFRAISHFNHRYRLWVDALCINQQDDKERGQQVGKMEEIYDNSWTVVAWLGKEADESDKAIDLLEILATYDEGKEESRILRDNLMAQPDFLGCGGWLALHEFLQRPYWSRLWIIQEIALGPPDMAMFCGSRSITWMKVRVGIGLIHVWLWHVKNSLIENDRKAISIAGEYSSLWDTTNLHHISKDLARMCQNEEREEAPLPFTWILQVAHSSIASNPMDKVYGLLAIMDPAISQHIRPDYTIGPSNLFSAVAQRQIMSNNNLEILREGNPWSKTNTPSWAPDWTWDDRNRDNQPSTPYHAAGNITASFSFSNDGRCLICKAIFVDRIAGIGAHEDGTNFDSPWSADSIVQPKKFESIYGDFTSTKTALYRTLVGDRSNHSNNCANDPNLSIFNLPSNSEVAIKQFKSLGWTDFSIQGRTYGRWQSWRQANAALNIGDRHFDNYFTDKIPENASNEDLWDAYLRWAATVSGRRLVLTERGRFGWTVDYRKLGMDEQTKCGDIFCIIFGCSTPIVIRPYGEYYQVLGEGYLQGLMEGEALAFPKIGNYRVQDITLC